MTRRPGLTLTEALVALFVAALGMISLLTLFPLGAIQMGQALKDARTAQAAAKADALMRWYYQTQVSDPVGPPGLPALPTLGIPVGADPFVLAFDNPNDNVRALQLRPTSAQNPVPPDPVNLIPLFPRVGANPGNTPNPGGYPSVAGAAGPSYPVFLDPIGWQARNIEYERSWVGGLGSGQNPNVPFCFIPRRTVRLMYSTPPTGGLVGTLGLNWDGVVQATPNLPTLPIPSGGVPLYNAANANQPRSIQFTTLLDDLTYDDAGSAAKFDPNTQTVAPIERLGRYSTAVMLQRPDNRAPHLVNMTVCVFENRAPGYAPPGSEVLLPRDSGLPLASPINVINLTPGLAIFRVYFAGDPPPIRKGQWVLDGTINPVLGIRNANFYRVASVTTDTDTAQGQNFLDVELQTPILPPLGLPAFSGSYQGQIYVLQGLSEVFVRPPIQLPLEGRPW